MIQFNKLFKIIFSLSLIWVISKFGYIFLSIPIWIILFTLIRLTDFQYLSILICSELFEGIDRLTFGPVSILQIIAVFLLFKVLMKIKPEKVYYLTHKVFLLLIICSAYYSASFFTYFGFITLSTINWVFILLLTVLSFNGRKDELIFFSSLFLGSVLVITIQTFLVQIYFYPDFILAKEFAVNNSNHLGFFVLMSTLFIIFLNGIGLARYKKLLKNIFYFFFIYLIFTGGRLNLVLLLLFILCIFIKPIKVFWMTKKVIIRLLLVFALVIASVNTTKNLIFRNSENFSFTEYEDFGTSSNTYLEAFSSGRSAFYLDAIELINEKFYFGNGFLSWSDINNEYNSFIAKNENERYSLHSTILQYWAETGLIGLSLYLLYLFSIATIGKKLIKSNDLFFSLSGIICFYVPVFMILGGTLDNHNLGYSLIHFTAGIAIVLSRNRRNQKHF